MRPGTRPSAPHWACGFDLEQIGVAFSFRRRFPQFVATAEGEPQLGAVGGGQAVLAAPVFDLQPAGYSDRKDADGGKNRWRKMTAQSCSYQLQNTAQSCSYHLTLAGVDCLVRVVVLQAGKGIQFHAQVQPVGECQ